MPKLRFYLGASIAALVTLIFRPLVVLARAAVAWVTPFWDLAFNSQSTWERPAGDFGEVIAFPALRAQARSFQARRLQRDPVDLSAGCGLRLAT